MMKMMKTMNFKTWSMKFRNSSRFKFSTRKSTHLMTSSKRTTIKTKFQTSTTIWLIISNDWKFKTNSIHVWKSNANTKLRWSKSKNFKNLYQKKLSIYMKRHCFATLSTINRYFVDNLTIFLWNNKTIILDIRFVVTISTRDNTHITHVISHALTSIIDSQTLTTRRLVSLILKYKI